MDYTYDRHDTKRAGAGQGISKLISYRHTPPCGHALGEARGSRMSRHFIHWELRIGFDYEREDC